MLTLLPSIFQVRTTSELPDFGQMSWDDLFNLDLDEILSVAPTSEPELEVRMELGETELSAAKTVVASVLEQSASQISNVSEVTEAADLLINS